MRRLAKSLNCAWCSIFLAVCSTGCLVIPTPEQGNQGLNLRRAVGDACSDRPIRPGHTTRRDVARLLGPAFDSSDGGPVWVFRAPAVRGFMIAFSPPPMGPFQTRDYYLRMGFDAANVLQSVELRRERRWEFAGMGMAVPPREWLSVSEWPNVVTARDTELVLNAEASTDP